MSLSTWCLLLAVTLLPLRGASGETPGEGDGDGPVTVVRGAEWFATDARRAGAHQFRLLLTLEQLRRKHPAVGVVGVTCRIGELGAELGAVLRLAAANGVPVLELVPTGAPVDEDSLFLRASGLSEAEAARVLADCLARLGPPPTALLPHAPAPREIARIRAHLREYQDAIALATATKLALR